LAAIGAKRTLAIFSLGRSVGHGLAPKRYGSGMRDARRANQFVLSEVVSVKSSLPVKNILLPIFGII
jgi:hypothetical protein